MESWLSRCEVIYLYKPEPTSLELHIHRKLMEALDVARLITEIETSRGIVARYQQVQRQNLERVLHLFYTDGMTLAEVASSKVRHKNFLVQRLDQLDMHSGEDENGHVCIHGKNGKVYKGKEYPRCDVSPERLKDAFDIDIGSSEEITQDTLNDTESPWLRFADLAGGYSIFHHIEAVQRYELSRLRCPTSSNLILRIWDNVCNALDRPLEPRGGSSLPGNANSSLKNLPRPYTVDELFIGYLAAVDRSQVIAELVQCLQKHKLQNASSQSIKKSKLLPRGRAEEP